MGRQRPQSACSFCGKRQDQVRRLIAGPGPVFICDECVALCNEIIAEEPPPMPPAASQGPPQARARGRWWQRLLQATAAGS